MIIVVQGKRAEKTIAASCEKHSSGDRKFLKSDLPRIGTLTKCVPLIAIIYNFGVTQWCCGSLLYVHDYREWQKCLPPKDGHKTSQCTYCNQQAAPPTHI